jgi:hypothetical protein
MAITGDLVAYRFPQAGCVFNQQYSHPLPFIR